MRHLSRFTMIIMLLAYAVAPSFAQATKGQIVFYNKKIDYQVASSATDAVKEYELGEPLYASALFEKNRAAVCKDCAHMNMRFSVDGTSYTTTQMRADYKDMYSAAAGPGYYAGDEGAGIQLISGKGWYFELYDLTEDAFRMFLSKISARLKPGALVPVKVELMLTKNAEEMEGPVLATGTLNIKVTDKVKDNANSLVRATAMLTDADVEKAIAEQFKVRITGASKVYKVVLVGNYNYKRNGVTGINENKNIDASVFYKHNDGSCWVAKHNYIFEFEGSDFSKLAKMGKLMFAAPVPAVCFE